MHSPFAYANFWQIGHVEPAGENGMCITGTLSPVAKWGHFGQFDVGDIQRKLYMRVISMMTRCDQFCH